jgi:hypothetical protein
MIVSFYQLVEGELKLYDELVKEFSHKPRDLMKSWWLQGKKFKTRASDDYPINLLSLPYQYVMAMICRVYGELDAQKLKVSWVLVIHYITTSRLSFN